mgnify:CR=1 FL=1
MIWYVEDDASIRDIGMYALNSAGFETKGIEDGLSFWEALKKEKPELIVLDVMLPGMDGIEILTKMKESAEFCSIPVIMATAKGQDYDRIKGLDLGADDYMVKPVDFDELFLRIGALLRRAKIDVTSVSINETRLVTGAHGIEVFADKISKMAGARNFVIKPA